MSNSKRQEMIDDHADQSSGEDYHDASSVFSAGDDEVETSALGSREIGSTEQLTDVTVDEDRVLQWLRALDMQVTGACRTDERLKPLLKSSASSGIAEERLLAHLSQHFEPSEVCMLARCFCIPLVSIRVGKINKQGTLLCPTSIRGNLSLSILPTSDLRLSFTGDDGHSEKLFALSGKSECSAVVIDEIPADNSGRSFFIKSPDSRAVYFWCSEKSKLLGIELIAKMRDLIMRKPSIAELTGISESRLGYLATHLRAYLVGSSLTLSNARASCSSSLAPSCTTSDLSDSAPNAQGTSASEKSLQSRLSCSPALKANTVCLGSLSPRSSSFKEGLPRNLSSLRSAAREKLMQCGDGYWTSVDSLTDTSPVTTDELHFNQSETEDTPEAKSFQLSSSFLESLGKLSVPPTSNLASQVPSISSPLFSPYYCWCPPRASSLSYPTAPSEFPLSLPSKAPSLPPLSSLLSANGPSSLLKPTTPCNLADIPSLDFPAFLPEPLVRLQVPSSQQIPTFTPLICDPIVHVPVIDVCSSGQGYLVSAGPAMSSTIPPLHVKLVNPLIPESNSVVENGARETLRLLISSSSQTNPPLMDVLPAVLTSANEMQNMLLGGSRGLYCGTRDVDAIGNSIALVSMSGSSIMGGTIVVDSSLEKLDAQTKDSIVPSGSCGNEESTLLADLKEERIDS